MSNFSRRNVPFQPTSEPIPYAIVCPPPPTQLEIEDPPTLTIVNSDTVENIPLAFPESFWNNHHIPVVSDTVLEMDEVLESNSSFESQPPSIPSTLSSADSIFEMEEPSSPCEEIHTESRENTPREIPSTVRRRSIVTTDVADVNPPSPPPASQMHTQYKGWIELAQLIPGLKQAVHPETPVHLRAFWALMVIAYLAGIFILIELGVGKTMSHSLIVTLETEEINNAHIPFPAIAFGTQSGFQGEFHEDIQWLKSHLNYRDKWHNTVDDITGFTAGVVVVFDQICDYQTTYGGKMGIQNNQSTNLAKIPQAARIQFNDNATDRNTKLMAEFVRTDMFNCEELVDGCYWNGKERNCSSIFRSAFTEHGSTCVFNGIPDGVAKRYVTAKTLLGHNYTTEETDAWKHVDVDFDAKYIDNLASPIGKPMKFPRKQNVPGQTSGLTFFLKQTVGNVGCVRSEGTGFRLSVNHPSEETQLLRFGKNLPFGHEVFVEVLPEVTIADDDIKYIPKHRRRCFFTNDDHSLDYYKKYTQQNCFAECISKRVEAKWNCSVVTSPGKQGRTLCNPVKMARAREVMEEMYQMGLDVVCKECLPNCNNFKYKTQITSTPIDPSRLAAFNKTLNLADTEITIVHVYLGSDSTRPQRRSARYSWFELIGLVGGIISLAGFSFIDILDILLSLRKLERPTPKLRMWVCLLMGSFPKRD